MATHQEVIAATSANSHSVDVLTEEELVGAWEQATGRSAAEVLVGRARVAANYAAPSISKQLAAS